MITMPATMAVVMAMSWYEDIDFTVAMALMVGIGSQGDGDRYPSLIIIIITIITIIIIRAII
jgi:hypothetical protein